MNVDRWRQVERIFQDALDQEPHERTSFLDRVCADDASLKSEIEGLIRSHEEAGSFIKSPAITPSAPGRFVGKTFGSYELKTLLGSGGMGEVYRGRDTKLGREVAIKVLPEDFDRDSEHVARFRREAEILASLNHPNIAIIHDLHEIGGTRFLVLELVEGETLAERITRGPVQPRETLEIAKQIAGALEAAHEKGIVHRDLKPANIKITPEGRVKVLDFGLAKVHDAERLPADFSNSPTLMSVRTDSGVILGTAAYMSPEQARGKTVDKRTDIWAFGAVLFEMLTGRQAFDGETVSDILVSVLSRDVDWNTLPPTLPSKIRDLLRRCLQREGMQRLRDIGDARIEIMEALTAGPAAPAAEAAVTAKRRPALFALAPALLVVMAFLGGLYLRRPAMPDAVPSWTGTRLGGPNVSVQPRISPDGKTLAFLALVDGLTQVAVMSPASGNWTVLTKERTRGWVSTLSWSRDGTRIYYSRFDTVPLGIYSVAAPLGGEERLVLENAAGPQPLPDGSLLVVRINADRQGQIYRYWPRDNRMDALPAIVTGPVVVPKLRVFPDGARAVFEGRPVKPSANPESLYLLDIATQNVSKIQTDLALETITLGIAVMPDGASVVVAVANGDLQRVLTIPLKSSGRSEILINARGISAFDIGPDGSLYVDQLIRPVEIVRFSPTGSELERINAFPNATMPYGAPALYLADGRTILPTIVGGRNQLIVAAPGKDGIPFIETDEETGPRMALLGSDRAAFVIGSGNERRVAVASLQDGRILRRLQSVKATISAMAASPDGKTLFYVAAKKVWSVPSDDGTPREIHSGDGVAVTPDGNSLIIQLVEAENVRWIRVNVDSGKEEPILVKGEIRLSGFPPSPGAIGRDGRILLPVSDAFWVKPAIFDPNTGSVQRIPLAYDGDFPYPAWTADGKIIAAAYPFLSSIWRFQPEKSAEK